MICIRLPVRMCLSVNIWMSTDVIRRHWIRLQKRWIVWINITCSIITMRRIHWINYMFLWREIRLIPGFHGSCRKMWERYLNGSQGFGSNWVCRMRGSGWSMLLITTGIYIWIFWIIPVRIRSWRAAIFHWKPIHDKWRLYFLWLLSDLYWWLFFGGFLINGLK